MQRKWYFCSLVTKPNQACIKYSPKCIWQFLLDCNIWRVPWDFYKQLPPLPHPPTLNTLTVVSLHFTKEALPSIASPLFLYYNPSSPLQKLHKISIGPEKSSGTLFLHFKLCLIFPHTGAPLNVHAVSIDPDVLP